MSDKVQTQVVIALMGSKGAGKDTLAELSIKTMNAVGKVASATFLKEICSKILKLPLDLFNTYKDNVLPRPFVLKGHHIRGILDMMDRALSDEIKKQHNLKLHKVGIQKYCDRSFMTPRAILQFIGTDMIQSIFKSFHCHIAYDKIRGYSGVWFITDLRFLHEEKYAREVFPLFYPILINGRSIEDDSYSQHISENEWKQIKPFATIQNNSSIDDLIKNASIVFQQIQDDVKHRIPQLTANDWKKMTCPSIVVKDNLQNTAEINGSSKNPNISFIYQNKNDIIGPVPRDL